MVGGTRRARAARHRLAAQRARAAAAAEAEAREDMGGERVREREGESVLVFHCTDGLVNTGLGQEGMEEEEEEVEELKTAGKVGTKKLRKLQEKADRKAQREVGVAFYTLAALGEACCSCC